MRILLCGDLVPTEATVPAFEAGDCATLMGDVLTLTGRADFSIANLECALTNDERRIRKCGPNLKGKPEYAEVIAKCGFTHMGFSNNHVMDFGLQGMRDTVDAVERAGMHAFGFGENDQDSRKPLMLEKDGQKVAVVAVCEHEYTYALRDRYGANPFDPFDTMEDIAEAKKAADWVIVMYHGGKEQCEYPSPRLRKACRAMVRAGADFVFCQHSHCVGSRESYRGGEIVYGEGNFNFVAHADAPHWQCGLIAELELGKAGASVAYHPVMALPQGVRLANPEEAQKIMAGFEERSAVLQDEDAWLERWRSFCEGATYYPEAVRSAYVNVPEGERCNQVFPHYLDCEAHLDVWKTIYPTWHAEGSSEVE